MLIKVYKHLVINMLEMLKITINIVISDVPALA